MPDPSAGSTSLPSSTTYLAPVAVTHSPAVSVHVLPSSVENSIPSGSVANNSWVNVVGCNGPTLPTVGVNGVNVIVPTVVKFALGSGDSSGQRARRQRKHA